MEQTKETIRLYDRDGYATEFEAEVISCEEVSVKGQTRYAVILDRTLFFPEEGGQSPDKGRLGGAEVLDVQIKKNVITHTLNQPLAVGSRIEGKVDWNHRFSNMQQHSGEHIFSGLVYKLFGFHNVGFHLSDQVVTMDFDGVLTPEDIDSIELSVNRAIAENIEVLVSYPTDAELEKIDYRSKIEIEGQVRIITIPGYDVCACCAPHVRHTGEIGILKVMSVQSYKGGVRVSILCGFRALMAFREKAGILSELSAILTTNQEALPENVSRLKAANQSLKSRLAAVRQAVMEHKVAELPEDLKQVVLFEQDLDTPVMRAVVNQLTERYDGICALFVGTDETGYNFIIGSKETDCRNIAALLKERLNARGGGSKVMIQGSLNASQERIEAFLQEQS